MDEIFKKLQSKGKTNTEDLIKWMKEAKIIDAAKADGEKRVRQLLKDVPDPRDVALNKFKEVVTKFAAEQKKPLEEFTSKLIGQGPAFLRMAETEHSDTEMQSPNQSDTNISQVATISDAEVSHAASTASQHSED